MQDILRIRNELSELIDRNNKNLTSEAVIKKALETEIRISNLTKK